MMYRHCFKFPNTGDIRKLIPCQPLLSLEVGVSFLYEKTLTFNLGAGKCTVNLIGCSKVRRSSHLRKQKWLSFKRLRRSRDRNGHLSHNRRSKYDGTTMTIPRQPRNEAVTIFPMIIN